LFLKLDHEITYGGAVIKAVEFVFAGQSDTLPKLMRKSTN
jgi:hypothetical protein